mmetsp:Transcript_773/g.1245  ORF Transcript_773/g.1245 Transcript_773/m.1245 type:complete len:96 (+) Transcript_773:861-1148(+)
MAHNCVLVFVACPPMTQLVCPSVAQTGNTSACSVPNNQLAHEYNIQPHKIEHFMQVSHLGSDSSAGNMLLAFLQPAGATTSCYWWINKTSLSFPS